MFPGGWLGGWVVGGNEIKATQPNLALAWPGLSLAIFRCQRMQIEDVPTVYNLSTDRFKERLQFGIVHQLEAIKFTVF